MADRNARNFFKDLRDRLFGADGSISRSSLWNKFDSICATVGVASKPFRNWSEEHAKIILKAAEEKWTNSRLKKLLNPKHTIEQTKYIFNCFKKLLPLSIGANEASIEKAIKKADEEYERRQKFIKKLGVEELYEAQIAKMSPEEQARFSEVSETVKLHFINICAQTTKVSLTDLDPDMTEDQANVLATAGKFYTRQFNPKDVFTGKIFLDENGRLPSARKMVEMICKDYANLMINDGNFKLNKEAIKNYALLQKLSYQVSGEANVDLTEAKNAQISGSLDYADIDAKYDYLESVAYAELKGRPDQILKLVDEEKINLDEMSYDKLAKMSARFSKDNPELGSKEYILNVMLATAIGKTDLSEKALKTFSNWREDNGYDGVNWDTLLLQNKIKAHMNDNVFLDSSYEIGKQKISFEEDKVTITSGNVTKTLTKEEFENPDFSSKDLTEFAVFGATGQTFKGLEEQAKENASRQKAVEKNDKEISNLKKILSRDISKEIGADNEVRSLQDKVRSILKNDDVRVVLTETGNIQICTPKGDQKDTLTVFNKNTNINEHNNGDKFLEKLNIKDEETKKDVLDKVKYELHVFKQDWEPEKIANTYKEKSILKSQVEVGEFLKSGSQFSISPDESKLGQLVNQIKEDIPSLQRANFIDGRLVLEMKEHDEVNNRDIKGLAVLNKDNRFEFIGAGKDLEKLTKTGQNKELFNKVFDTSKKLQNTFDTALSQKLTKSNDSRSDR